MNFGYKILRPESLVEPKIIRPPWYLRSWYKFVERAIEGLIIFVFALCVTIVLHAPHLSRLFIHN